MVLDGHCFLPFQKSGADWSSWTKQAGMKQGLWSMSTIPFPGSQVSSSMHSPWCGSWSCRSPDIFLLLRETWYPKQCFHGSCFWCCISNLITKPRVIQIFTYVLQVLQFCTLHLGLCQFQLFFVKGIRFTTPSQAIYSLPFHKTLVSLVYNLLATSYLSSLLLYTNCPISPLVHMVWGFLFYCQSCHHE